MKKLFNLLNKLVDKYTHSVKQFQEYELREIIIL
jgi:hypothetical protein